jgi:hypothetical protein
MPFFAKFMGDVQKNARFFLKDPPFFLKIRYIKGVMQVAVENYPGFRVVGKRMYELSQAYAGDLSREFSALPLDRAVEAVSEQGYSDDDTRFNGAQVLARPREMSPPIDCKKMTILLGAWAVRNGRPFKFIAVAEEDTDGDGKVTDRDIHHVIILIFTPIHQDGVLCGMREGVLCDPTRKFDVVQPLYAEVL